MCVCVGGGEDSENGKGGEERARENGVGGNKRQMENRESELYSSLPSFSSLSSL